eukprot:gb/GEZJ01002842.1/.p1 GENE.gb/GEZJ01002842.1/~~gb/GEZJ01002842.1/.p1  ORF type:complete len:361 (+),score=51.15 gb/GEZJ01002842.1/:561-1643(+)
MNVSAFASVTMAFAAPFSAIHSASMRTSFLPVRLARPSKFTVTPQNNSTPITSLSTASASDSAAACTYEDDGTRVIPISLFLAATRQQQICGVYALLDMHKEPVYIGMSRNVYQSVHVHYRNHPHLVCFVKVMTFVIPMAREMKLMLDSWILDNEVTPRGNTEAWTEADVQLAEQARLLPDSEEQKRATDTIVSPFENDPLVDATNKQVLKLCAENVESVLDEVRPYLVSDGGNVSVVHVDIENGRVQLKLEGACSSCASAATTMRLGIQKALKQTFGTQLNEVVAIDTQMATDGLSIEVCERALDAIKETLRGLGADVSVSEIDEGEVVLSFIGPNSLRYGVEKTLMDKVPGIDAVTFE